MTHCPVCGNEFHEFFINAYLRARECYPCKTVEVLNKKNVWIKVETAEYEQR